MVNAGWIGRLLLNWLLAGVLAACTSGNNAPAANVENTAVSPTPATIFLPLTQSPTPGMPATPAATTTPALVTTAAPTITPEPPCLESGAILTGSLTSQWAGALPYRIYYPPCYAANGRAYPTLYLLPGNVHTDAIWQDLGLAERADTLIQTGAIAPLLIVMADGGWLAQNSSGGPGSYESVILLELIPHVEAYTCAWAAPEARAIGGISRGGYWALEIAFRHADSFAGVGGHSAALIDSYAGPDINPRYTALSHSLGGLQIYLDIGGDDYLFDPLNSLHEDMIAQQIPHTWVLNQGTHEEAYWATHLPDYLRWYGSLWPAAAEMAPLCAKLP